MQGKTTLQCGLGKIIFVGIVLFQLACTQKKSTQTIQQKDEEFSSYYSCLVVNDKLTEAPKDEKPGICFNTNSGVESYPSDEFFIEKTVLHGNTYKANNTDRIDVNQARQNLRKVPASELPSQVKYNQVYTYVKPGKVNQTASTVLSPKRQKFIEVLTSYISKKPRANHGSDTQEVIQLSQKEPYEHEDINIFSNVVMDKETDAFKTHAKFLSDQITLYENQPKVRQQLQQELINLGKIRKEVEYSQENQVQALKLWEAEIAAKIADQSATDQANVRQLFGQAIKEKSTKTFFDSIEKSTLIPKVKDLLLALKRRKFIAISRPVEDIGYQRIANGYDGKPVNMKGKSSTQTGFIPLNQLASKLPRRYLDELAKRNSAPSVLIKDLIKYQHKSDLGLVTIEPNFLPTSIAKPFIKETRLNNAQSRFELAVVKKIDLAAFPETEFQSALESLP
ncbi:MAG: anthrax toxin-like adenylyl cyclase domain-containing protein, partial [Cellvibrionales bacterium]|nr:anthrax toxin-like adenylyl cyclase domain-containing protein [Cellvibrionales bacterium]